MNPVTHFFVGCAVGLPVLLDLARRHSPESMEYWSSLHHSFHNILFAAVVGLLCLALAKRRYITAGLAFLAVNLHYLCDIAGSRGPDGYHWPIPYLIGRIRL